MATVYLIDGFNFYHSIKPLNPKFHWLDYYNFCKHYTPTDEIKVIFFTAKANWLVDAVKRHDVFLEACKINNVDIILGKFKEKTTYCKKCRESTIHHEEKYTDVNIALTSYRLAIKSDIEKIIFVTGDTDLVPALKAIKEDFPNKKVGVLFPLKKGNRELKQVADFSFKTTLETLEKYVMPKVLIKETGKKVICPDKWIK